MTSICDDYAYNEVEQHTWRCFFQEIEKAWAKHRDIIHPYYIDNIGCLERFRERIPALKEIQELLASVGWTAAYVDGFAPPWHIAQMLDRRIMPVSRSIRPAEEVFFANGPDLIHDIFGHLPMLMSDSYRQLLAKWSYPASRLEITETDRVNFHLNRLIMQSEGRFAKPTLAHLKGAAKEISQFIADHPTPSLEFEKTYFWIFEFGIVKLRGQMKIMGAGILSSMSELEKIGSQNVKIFPLDSKSILAPYNISTAQDGYLIASDMQHYKDILSEMKAMLSAAGVAEERLYAQG